jgi:para-aminobenzoate synthetase component I
MPVLTIDTLNHSFSANRFALYFPGKGIHKYGFEPTLLTGNEAINNLSDIEAGFSAGLICYNEIPGTIVKPGFIPFQAVDMFKVENQIDFSSVEHVTPKQVTGIQVQPLVTKTRYIEQVNKLKKHIQRGDIYEINYCVEFRAENVKLDPVSFFSRLYHLTKAPFSCLYKTGERYIFSASPERFLQRTGSRIISQPIKGTIKKGASPEENEKLKHTLLHSQKERSENVMITDLVRNDLSRLAKKGTVHVDELCGIYSFETVHQMISTISCELKEGISLKDILLATFPMGSMTGAPKISAMKFIRQFESMERGAYSGSIGYFKDAQNFDMNVVIRSIIYDAQNQRLCFSVGSAITHYSNSEDEYNECLLKADALLKALGVH